MTAFTPVEAILGGALIVLTGMGNSARVLNFFDLFGTWDPTLLLVMVSALIVTMIGYRFVLKRPASVLAGALPDFALASEGLRIKAA